jgi:hypothetical protein
MADKPLVFALPPRPPKLLTPARLESNSLPLPLGLSC